ncbi:MAG: glucosamine-6-phosphate deaminase [Candidatus Poribacteria bacterium]|nr:glucosamine-6-phosphate deaminase [Candidatus Poribacteria bacterium]
MEVIIQPTYAQLVAVSAEIIRGALLKKPNLVLGLATGSTPIGLYEALARMHKTEGLDFSAVTTFNLDEYVGIPRSHPYSYHTFMETHFFNAVNIPAENRHIPQSTAVEHEEFCEQYETAIVNAGGIDIQVLGIGKDGHIGFNEPSSSLGSRTRIKTLTQGTLEANAPHFGGTVDAVPKMAITMGVGTIMEAKQCLLLANGESKAEAIAHAVEGPITAEVPASVLQMHPRTVVIIDEEAASQLKRVAYYKQVYANKQKLLSGGY